MVWRQIFWGIFSFLIPPINLIFPSGGHPAETVLISNPATVSQPTLRSRRTKCFGGAGMLIHLSDFNPFIQNLNNNLQNITGIK
jgi:hypothetical protein